MSLVPCKECGKEISSSAQSCPYCGISYPGQTTGDLEIYRRAKFDSFFYPMTIYLNNVEFAKIGNNEKLTFEGIQEGKYTMKITLGVTESDNCILDIPAGKKTRIELWFDKVDLFSYKIFFRYL